MSGKDDPKLEQVRSIIELQKKNPATPESRAEALKLYAAAQLAVGEGDFTKVRTLCLQAIRKDFKCAGAHFVLADIMWNAKLADDARAHFTFFLTFANDDPMMRELRTAAPKVLGQMIVHARQYAYQLV